MPRPIAERVLALARRHGVLRARDLTPHSIPREYLKRLHAQGILERPARGMYMLANAEGDENQTLREACKRVPHGVVSLLSALRFHGLTTQAPFEVWLGINVKARLPKVDYPPLRIVRFSGPALAVGIEEHVLQGVLVRVTNPARTVVDCFKYRNKVGLDVALEAFRDCRHKRKATMDEILRIAQVLRMANVMRPYMEAMA